MFIYHFHRIIRHRLVWGAFAVVVSLAFLSVDSCYKSGSSGDSVAKIGGKNVSADTFDQLERQIRGLGRNRKELLPFPDVATQVWHQVAALQVAEELKLSASREEVKAAVQESIGATDGYDSTVHAAYLGKLKEINLRPAQYEQFLAHNLTLRKLGSIVESAAWVTPIEVDDELAGLTDELTVRTITVSNRFAGIRATDAQIAAFFEANTNSFHLPRRVAVQYVSVALSNLLPRISVSEEQIKEYYDDHGEKLTRSNSTDTLPLAEARALIIPILKLQNARQTAYTNLTTSFLELAVNGGDSGFARAAEDFGLAVRKTPLFALDEPPAGIEDIREFREAAFELDPARPDDRYSVVQGESFVYAMAPLTNSPAHMPVLEEVVDRVRPLAAAKARSDAFRDSIEALHKNLLKGLQEKRDPVAAARAQSLNISTSITFAVHTLYQNPFDNYMPVARAALHLQPGMLSEAAMAGEEDAAIFVYMVNRQPGDPLSAEMLRPKARANIERARGMGLNNSWMEWNLSRKGLALTPRMLSQLSTRPEASRPSEE
ncbi:MAG: SurA N-terminal domain-containing protein [bacterium]